MRSLQEQLQTQSLHLEISHSDLLCKADAYEGGLCNLCIHPSSIDKTEITNLYQKGYLSVSSSEQVFHGYSLSFLLHGRLVFMSLLEKVQVSISMLILFLHVFR